MKMLYDRVGEFWVQVKALKIGKECGQQVFRENPIGAKIRGAFCCY